MKFWNLKMKKRRKKKNNTDNQVAQGHRATWRWN